MNQKLQKIIAKYSEKLSLKQKALEFDNIVPELVAIAWELENENTKLKQHIVDNEQCVKLKTAAMEILSSLSKAGIYNSPQG